jgi:hypothetical protein
LILAVRFDTPHSLFGGIRQGRRKFPRVPLTSKRLLLPTIPFDHVDLSLFLVAWSGKILGVDAFALHLRFSSFFLCGFPVMYA